MDQRVQRKGFDERNFFDAANGIKRYGYLLSWLPPLLLMVSAFTAQATSNGIWLWLLVLFGFVGIPLVDLLFGKDNSNPSADAEQALQNNPFYIRTLYAAVVLHWVAFVYMAYTVAMIDVSWLALLGGMLSAGVSNGMSVVVGHELGHKITDVRQSLMGRVMLACSAFGHYTLSHNVEHHKLVATPDDPSSAGMGENLYRFFLREAAGTLRGTWKLERSRAKKHGRSIWSLTNKTFQAAIISVVCYSILFSLFGLIMVPYLLIASLLAWWLLSNASYVEHYGLLREQAADGTFQRCGARHSWNSNYLFSNLLMLQVQRHSDHHQHPSRPYQLLRVAESMPMLPLGYPAMFLLAMIPPLWFAVMNPRLLKWAGDDLDKINIFPARRDSLFRRYSSTSRQV